MRSSIACLALLAGLGATAASADSRMRSSDYEGTTVAGCYDWQIDFAFESCSRMPVPGSETEMAQVYTLADGTTRRLTQDPAQGMPNLPMAAAAATRDEETGQAAEGGERVRYSQREGTTAPVRSQPSTAQQPEEPVSAESGPADAGAPTLEEEFDLRPVVRMVPGDAEILPLAVGHLNRIETPFDDPAVRTSAPDRALNIQFDGNYVYVSITQPVTVFLHEKGHPDPALVISLVPKRIAPRQVRLDVPGNVQARIDAYAAPAAPAETSEPETVIGGVTRDPDAPRRSFAPVQYLSSFIEGRLPAGFQYGTTTARARSYCRARGVRFSFEQGAFAYNSEYMILRGLATASEPQKLREQWCTLQPDTVAVAYAPRLLVGPDSPVDFFILLRRDSAAIQTVAE